MFTSHKHWTRPNLYRAYPDADTSGKDHISCLLNSNKITSMNSRIKYNSVQAKGFKAGYVDSHAAGASQITDASGCKNFVECVALPRRGMEQFYKGSSYDPERNIWRDGCSLIHDTYSWGVGGFGMAGDGEWGLPQVDTRGGTPGKSAILAIDYFWMGTVKKSGDDASPKVGGETVSGWDRVKGETGASALCFWCCHKNRLKKYSECVKENNPFFPITRTAWPKRAPPPTRWRSLGRRETRRESASIVVMGPLFRMHYMAIFFGALLHYRITIP